MNIEQLELFDNEEEEGGPICYWYHIFSILCSEDKFVEKIQTVLQSETLTLIGSQQEAGSKTTRLLIKDTFHKPFSPVYEGKLEKWGKIHRKDFLSVVLACNISISNRCY